MDEGQRGGERERDKITVASCSIASSGSMRPRHIHSKSRLDICNIVFEIITLSWRLGVCPIHLEKRQENAADGFGAVVGAVFRIRSREDCERLVLLQR